MSLDDVLIAITLGGLFLSGTYIRAGFRESRRERDFQMRRSERVSDLAQGTDQRSGGGGMNSG
jgi:hypothetical protein